MKYRKTIEVEARQFPPLTEGWHEHEPLSLQELADWCGGASFWFRSLDDRPYIIIPTLQGDMRAWPGDWIVKGIGGEFYPVKPEVFEKSYERVSDGPT